MATKGAYAVIIVPKICWEGRTQPWMSLFLLALEVVVVAHQGELGPSENGPALSCFENTSQGKGPPEHCGELICEQRDLQHEQGKDRASSSHLKALRAITTGSGILGSVLGRRNQSCFYSTNNFYSHLQPVTLMVCCPGLSCIRIPLSNWDHIKL